MASPELAERVVELHGLSKKYAFGDSHVEVLRGIDLTLSAGESCAIMGPSGVGKSTLLACISGLTVADGGSLTVLGSDLLKENDRGRTLLRRKMGIIYQFFHLVPNLTVTQNVALPFLVDGLAPDDRAVEQLIERVGLKGRKEHLPSQLSGGEMQLVAIARALVRKPRLVLADEPTGNVNVETGRRILALFLEVLRESGAALLLVTHHPEHAARFGRVEFLKDGVLAGESALRGEDVTADAVHDRLRSLGI
ncbi:MAG: ABC transporter ATP-binding protein [Polyangiaceae bacterium]|nr:ABC transporter ATP-binding protein [Polyangiaceae bacterium]